MAGIQRLSPVPCESFSSVMQRGLLCAHTLGELEALLYHPQKLSSILHIFLLLLLSFATFPSFVEILYCHKIFLIRGECESSQGTVRTQQQQLALCTSLPTFACGWWYLCRTNGCWWAEMVDSPRSFIYSPLMRSRQFDLRCCHMGRSYGGQAWYTVASQAFFQAFPW